MLVEPDGFLRQRLAASGIAHIDQSLAEHVFLDDRNIGDKHQQSRRLCFAPHGGFDQKGPRFAERHGRAALGDAIARFAPDLFSPALRFRADIICPAVVEKVILKIAIFPPAVGWSGLQGVLDVLREVKLERLELHLVGIAVSEGEAGLTVGKINAALTKNDVGLGYVPQLLASVGGALVLWGS